MRYKKIIIIGAGQTAEQIYYLAKYQKAFESIEFAVDSQYKDKDTLCGSEVHDLGAVLSTIDLKSDAFFVAMSWNRLNHHRTLMYNRIKECQVSFANIIANTADIYGNVVMGDNIWISELAIVGCLANIGNNVFIQPSAVILHNVNIHDHCFIGSSSVIGGNSEIGSGSFIGLGAIIHNDIRIGKKCIVGAGAIVRRDIPDYSIVYPAQSKVVQADEATVLDKLTVKQV
jgi:sugar O-acyltransferase (sialic acid O-acetyltransferase NeuD family)